ncbi:MAG: hypothetical protein HFI13_00980 [Lachnospiraceae bacterium]|jgi:hypothetical protein|nr:hypothetical protein [Lachnospiraceae bacterium]MCI9658461.1 hypothetical protein [Lachnospiraceae bacterium]
MKKTGYFLAVFALVCVMTAGIDRAWAYFSTYAEASGGISLRLGDETEIEEKFSSWVKHVTISNKEGSEPVYIRAKAFSGSSYTLEYSGEGWEPGEDGYYYYKDSVPGGGSAKELSVRIGNVPEEELKDGLTFNVIVIYESTPVLYREDGTPYADWNAVLDSGSSSSEDGMQKEGE